MVAGADRGYRILDRPRVHESVQFDGHRAVFTAAVLLIGRCCMVGDSMFMLSVLTTLDAS
jgi:hypothetical protein